MKKVNFTYLEHRKQRKPAVEKTTPVTRNIMPRRLALCVALLWLPFWCFSSNASLPPQLIVNGFSAGCAGAGTIVCELQDAQGSNIQFRIYLLPDMVTPVAVLSDTNNSVNVPAGNYQVVASETVDGNVVTYPPQNILITNTIIPLSFGITHTDAHCNDGTLTVNVTNGSGPFHYEILSGPETFPPQSSNVFTNLSGGIYNVRVTDGCGVQLPLSYTVPQDNVEIQIGSAQFPYDELPSCNEIIVRNLVSAVEATDLLLYPMQCTYTVYPPGGGTPTIITNTVFSGEATSANAEATIPFWYDTTYFYDLEIVDPCGEVWTKTNIPVNQELLVILETSSAECNGYMLGIRPKNFVGPYTVTFSQAPADFDPLTYNSGHPGPFSHEVTTYGNSDLAVPFGNYAVTVTDACGHSATQSQEIEDIPIEPMDQLSPHPGCESNVSDLEIYWPGMEIINVTISQAPSAYPNAIPEDVSSGIFDVSYFGINNLPAGEYLFVLENACGVIFELPVEVQELAANLDMLFSTRADCEPGMSGIRISGTGSSIVSITMTAAPTGFGQTLPLDVSNFLTTNGVFSMGNIPPGLYSFDIWDSCGVNHILTDKQALPYVVEQNDISVTKHCNSFEVLLDLNSQNTISEFFWLQRFDGTNWIHPENGTIYIEGTAPNAGNAIQLDNHENNINLDFLGTFRVIKSFSALDDGFVGPNPFKACPEVLYEFEHDGNVHIEDVVKLTCDGALSSVKVIADGVSPFSYSIVEKNGQPFLIENGSNDTFTGLEPAIYKFVVEQITCGGTDPYVVDISSLPSLVDSYPPEPVLYACENPANDGTGDFDLSIQDDDILGPQDPSLFTITYHSTQADADSGANPLASNHSGSSGTVYGRIAVIGGDCYKTVSFDLVVNPIPEPGFSQQAGLCPGSETTLVATPGYDSYLWSDGSSGNSLTVDEPGTYSLTLSKNYPSGACSATYDIVVNSQPVPVIREVTVADWTDRDNSITVVMENPENVGFEFSIDGTNWQSSAVFEGLMPGSYQVMVRDTAGCGEDSRLVHLLMYPKFFTPNGDGYNDFWKVKFSELEPGMETYIFDRYGKFIKQLGYSSEGWDGTSHGKMLPSTDYWFLVKRADGRQLRGHFAMKR